MSVKTLIYERNASDRQILSYSCKQLNMIIYEADSKDKAEKLMLSVDFDLAIVNLTLEKIKLNSQTKIITTGKPGKDAIFDNQFYNADTFMSKPLSATIIRFKLLQFVESFKAYESYYSKMVSFVDKIKEFKFLFESYISEELISKKSDFLFEYYCTEACTFSEKPKDVGFDKDKYKIIVLHAKRGLLVCKFVDECKLHGMKNCLNEKFLNLASFNIKDFFIKTFRNITLLDAIQELTDGYSNVAHQFVNIKENFCVEKKCFSSDMSKIEARTQKKLCCENGCVLDNYFDLLPCNKEYCKTVLIYMRKSEDLDELCSSFEKLKMKMICTDKREDANEYLKKENIDLLFVDYELDKLDVPRNLPVIASGKTNISATASILSYLPVSFIPSPFDIANVSQGILKALRLYSEHKTFFAFLTNVSMLLEEAHLSFKSFVDDSLCKMTFKQACVYFCENKCKFAKGKEDIADEDINNYEILSFSSARGTIYCDRKKGCQLLSFNEAISKNLPDISSLILSNNLNTFDLNGDNDIFELIEGLLFFLEEVLTKLEESQENFCKSYCTKSKKDMNFSRGDILFSDLSLMLNSNECTYCAEKECPLIAFFEYNKKTIV